MSAQHTPGRRQCIGHEGSTEHGWKEFEVVSYGGDDYVSSRTRVRSNAATPSLDISIEEFTGITRRAKYTSVRLEEAAARRLYETLHEKFGGAA